MVSRQSGQSGFTLLELLLVVLVAGIMAGLAVMAVGGNAEREFRRDVARIQQVMILASDEAQFNAVELGLWIAPDGKSYGFYTFDDKALEWVPYDKEGFASHPLPAAYQMEIQLENKPIDLAELYREIFHKDDPLETFDEKPFSPLVIFFSDGDYTPFHLWITHPGIKDFVYALDGDGIGHVGMRSVAARDKPDIDEEAWSDE